MTLRALAVLAAGLLWMAPTNCGRRPTPQSAEEQKARPSIGKATMDKNGTIYLDLRAEGPGGITGDRRLVYPKSLRQYQEILQHLGGLEPGQTKPVPPWPEN